MGWRFRTRFDAGFELNLTYDSTVDLAFDWPWSFDKKEPSPKRANCNETPLVSSSRAKFDEEADFDVRSAVDLRKPHQIDENRKFRSKIFANFFFRRRTTKRPKSSETRFGKVSWRSEPCSSSYEKIFTSTRRRELNPQPHIFFFCTAV